LKYFTEHASQSERIKYMLAQYKRNSITATNCLRVRNHERNFYT